MSWAPCKGHSLRTRVLLTALCPKGRENRSICATFLSSTDSTKCFTTYYRILVLVRHGEFENYKDIVPEFQTQ